MSVRIAFALVLSVGLAVAACRAQEASGEGAPQPTPAASAERDKEAEEILEKAIAAQGAGDLARDVSEVELSFALTTRANGNRVVVDVEERYKAPDKLWRRVKEAVADSEIEEGFDGRVGWNKKKDGKCVRFEGPEWKKDRARLEGELGQTRLLMRFFFVANIADALEDPKRAEDRVLERENGSTVDCLVVRGRARLPEDDGGDCAAELLFEKSTFLLVGARLERETLEPKVVTFLFDGHSPTRQQVVVPGSIKEYLGDAKDWSYFVALDVEEIEVEKDGETQTVAVNKIRFNGGLDDAAFAAPETK